MGDWPGESYAGILADISFDSFQNGAVANTKSSWQEIIASTTYAGYLSVHFNPSDVSDFLIDLAIGAGGSEVVILENYMLSNPVNYQFESNKSPFILPILIPAGTRISWRTQSTVTTSWCNTVVGVIPAGGGNVHQYALCKTYGTNTADSGGTSIDPGASTGVKGSYTQLTAGVDYDVRGLMFCIANGGNYVRNASFAIQWNMDLAIGAGDEIIMADYHVGSRDEGDLLWPDRSAIIPVNIPAGTRIRARSDCTVNDAADRLYDLSIYCFS